MPEPLVVLPSVSHAALLVATHPHPVPTVTETLAGPPAADIIWFVGATE